MLFYFLSDRVIFIAERILSRVRSACHSRAVALCSRKLSLCVVVWLVVMATYYWQHSPQLLWAARSGGVALWNKYHEKFHPAPELHDLTDQDEIILFWTPFFGHLKYNIGYGRKPFGNCPRERRCVTTNQRSWLKRSSALVFHPPEFSDLDLPPRSSRDPGSNQRLNVFFMLESAVHTGAHFTPGHTAAMFNITMTYRRDSDIVQPYYVLEPRNGSCDPGELDLTLARSRLTPSSSQHNSSLRLPWVVSNCHTNGKRENFVQELARYVQVDIYGRCGQMSCSAAGGLLSPPDAEICYRFLARNGYRFYLALENSRCRDYITEKFFLALKHGLIPVVYGAPRQDYELVAPASSFVHVQDFSSIQKLVQFLTAINQDAEKLAKYHQWRQMYFVRRVLSDGWCKLCEIIHHQQQQQRTHNKQTTRVQHYHQDINLWWNKPGICQ